jgi:hypothetical protein
VSRLKKTIDKILAGPDHMGYSTIHALLRRFGYHIILTRHGSHFSYWNDEADMKTPLIVVAHDGKVYEFDNIIEQLNLGDWHEDDKQ